MSAAIDKLAEQYSKLLLERMEQLKSDWKKPWVSPAETIHPPCNIRGTAYRGNNFFFLSLLAEFKNYKLPVWLTFKQAENLGCKITKGAKAAAVDSLILWAVNKETKQIISENEYRKLTPEKKDEYDIRSRVSYFYVFNVSQTNLKEIKPKIWAKLEKQFEKVLTPQSQENYKNELLDNVIHKQTWDCPINEKESNRAFYSPSESLINMPLRTQFSQREEFYSTLIHEMAHSTLGTGMNRERNTPVGVDSYGHEELIAELSAGLTSSLLGISAFPSDDNVKYLKSWITNIKQDPHYIYNCMGDVKKIVKYFSTRLDIQHKQDITLLDEEDFSQKKSKKIKL
ncbi:MAG: zincin-like metallopeptidase domain-containing protein [Bacteroidales bacterium]